VFKSKYDTILKSIKYGRQIIASHVFRGLGMIKVLIIAYMFPPIAGGGTQRPLKFVKYLPQNGITPVVFCPRKACWKTYDEKLLDLPFLKKTNIYRCGIRQLQKYYYLRYKKNYKHHPYFYMLAIRFFLYLDIFSAWFFECRHHALEIIKKEKIDCVLTTSPPHSIHLFGRFLKKKAGIPWIMDIRDAIYDDPNRPATLVTMIQAPIRLWYEKRFFSSSDAIVSVSDPIIESINRRHRAQRLESKLWAITNGFDDEDFAHIPLEEHPRKHMLISYTGSLMGKQTPEIFLEAIRLLIEKNAIDPADFRLRFVGDYDNRIQSIFQRFSAQMPIEIQSFQPYEKSLWHQVNSDLLLLIVSTDSKAGVNQTMTGKFFEYIGARRPVFALVPDGPLKDLIQKGNFGTVASPKDISQIADRFLTVFQQWKKDGAVTYAPDLQLRNQFGRKYLTEKLAGVVRTVVHQNA
jgi:glycosyltransferase involved in cell wall biosynthesis